MQPNATTTVCIVGGGPAGIMLSYLLARKGIDVTVLEAQKDFDRFFRGDTIHTPILENLAQLGLIDDLLKLPHQKMREMSIQDGDETIPVVSFSTIKTDYPYVMLMDQSIFLTFIVEQASRYPNFHIHMGTSAQNLLWEDGSIRGVEYRGPDGSGAIEATLTVACDGRGSKLRRLAALTPIPQTDPLEVLWCRIPRYASDPAGFFGTATGGATPVVLLQRENHYQGGLVLPVGSYQTIKRQGLAAFQKRITDPYPQFADRISTLDSWQKIVLLKVTGSRLKQWYLDGLLLIGDAAHVMTPLGGVGINYAIQDAIVAGNVLAHPLKTNTLTVSHLAEVQRQREWPTKMIQRFQAIMQRRVLGPTLSEQSDFTVPSAVRWLPKIPGLRRIPPRIISTGFRRVTVH